MRNRLKESFYARFLGEFSLRYGDQEIQIDISLQTKYMQILIRLLKAGADGVERTALMDAIWPEEDDLKKRMNNFRAQRFLLRKMIDRLAFPEGTYILRRKDRYYFSFDHQVETDTGHLDQLLDRLQGNVLGEQEHQDLLWQFCQGYPAHFLPALSTETWVIEEDVYYHKWYTKYTNELYEVLSRQKNFEKMLELCTAANHIDPYDEWQLKQIDCLMALNRQAEAMAVYEQARQIYHEDLGVNVLDQVMERYRDAFGTFYCAANAMSDIKKQLRETEEELKSGAYYCPYPSFRDAYQFTARLSQQLKMECLLMICTLLEHKNRPEASEKTLREMELLRQALLFTIRKDDVVTKYSQNQFLVLMPGVKKAKCAVIAERLEHTWNSINPEPDMMVMVEFVEIENGQAEAQPDKEQRAVYRIDC